jgi:hypothetical protein
LQFIFENPPFIDDYKRVNIKWETTRGYPFRSLEAGPGAWFDFDVLGVLEVHGENQWVEAKMKSQLANTDLVGGIPTPLKNMKVNGNDYPI